MFKRPLHISLVQYSASIQKSSNLKFLAELLTEYLCQIKAKESEIPHLICLPEVFNFYSFGIKCPNERLLSSVENAETIEEGETFQTISRIAAENNVYILAGSILETNPNCPQKPYNTAFFVDNNGQLVTKYRKINLFNIVQNEHTKSCNVNANVIEAENRSAGNKLATFEIAGWKLGVTICFDLRFPELFRAYRDLLCDVILVPSAFLDSTGVAHWELLLRARAIENQCYIAGINQSKASSCYGHSMLIDPWGTILEKANYEDVKIISTTLDPEYIKKIRECMLIRGSNPFNSL